MWYSRMAHRCIYENMGTKSQGLLDLDHFFFFLAGRTGGSACAVSSPKRHQTIRTELDRAARIFLAFRNP